jgi:hypothetical protein
MPPVLFALAAAAGFFAAARLFAMAMDSHEDTWRQANEEPKGTASASDSARDLGRLEWDEASGVYKPRPPQSS